MSVNTETASAQGQTTVLEKEGVYASLFEKINLTCRVRSEWLASGDDAVTAVDEQAKRAG